MTEAQFYQHHDKLFRSLSKMETEVAMLVWMSFLDKEIADWLRISKSTVRLHVNNAIRKTGARNRVHLAVIVERSHGRTNLIQMTPTMRETSLYNVWQK